MNTERHQRHQRHPHLLTCTNAVTLAVTLMTLRPVQRHPQRHPKTRPLACGFVPAVTLVTLMTLKSRQLSLAPTVGAVTPARSAR